MHNPRHIQAQGLGGVLCGMRSHQKVNQKSNVILFRPAHSGSALTITQADLAEERMLALEASNALYALRLKRAETRSALELGAAIEPGLRTVRIFNRRDMVIR